MTSVDKQDIGPMMGFGSGRSGAAPRSAGCAAPGRAGPDRRPVPFRAHAARPTMRTRRLEPNAGRVLHAQARRWSAGAAQEE